MVLLLSAPSLWARPVGLQANLATQLETQVQSAVEVADPALPLEELLDEFPSQEEQEIRQVIQELNSAKIYIQQQFKFPANEQDRQAAGYIFGRLMPVMRQYEHLRAQNLRVAQVAGLAIVQEKFISKDGREFYVPAFIKEYAGLLQPAVYPKNQVFSLINEFNEFRDNILQDKASFN